ncbi:MAG TPA: 23S rRNA pseudouridine(1911/1915/1917) synthase RluD [Gammaproteobacteria bacterium]|nr:23S rRNA pseudouridine(1911/1915/1917) synthase RluD [Gammaproteobacteria bacterium]
MSRIVKRLSIPSDLAGRRLDQAAAELMPEFSRSRLRAWIDAGALLLGGREAKARMLVKGGEEIALQAELEAAVEVQAEPIPLAVVHADDALLVIDKPVGLVVHPGAGNRSGTLQNALLHRYPELAVLPRAGLVHRLDKDTSGLLLVARTLSSHTALVAALERREINRTYRAICQGVLTGGGTIDAPIGRHRRERTKMAVMEGGRAARTRYRVVERFRAHTFCELELETGRTHQIRVHMAHIRAPLLGDPVYGGRPKLPPAASDELRAALQALRRQALHASRLQLAHPITGAPLAFESPIAADLAALLELLRADASGALR